MSLPLSNLPAPDSTTLELPTPAALFPGLLEFSKTADQFLLDHIRGNEGQAFDAAPAILTLCLVVLKEARMPSVILTAKAVGVKEDDGQDIYQLLDHTNIDLGQAGCQQMVDHFIHFLTDKYGSSAPESEA